MFELLVSPEFDEWVTSLRDRTAKLRVAARLDRMEMGNFGDVKPVGSGVSELRIQHGPGYRVYFKQRGKTIILLLCGGDKSTQTKDIVKAMLIAEEMEANLDKKE